MTGGEPGPELRALGDREMERPRDALPRGAGDVGRGPVGLTGLAALHTTLDRLVATLGLRSLTVVVDDPDLGRQAFRAGEGPFGPGTLTGEPGCRSEPPLPSDRVDAELLVELCATCLRLEFLRGDVMTGLDAAELALRRLPGVRAVVVERDDDLLVVQVHADADAPSDLARAAARAAAPLAGNRLVIEVVREAAAAPPMTNLPLPLDLTPEPTVEHEVAAVADAPLPAAPAPESEPGASDLAWTPELPPQEPAASPASAAPPLAPTAPSAPSVEPEIVVVRGAPETGEIEVHVRWGEVRTIGRAPMAQGLAGAVTASLDALRQVDASIDVTLGWARTIETTADRRFVVELVGSAGHDQLRLVVPREEIGGGRHRTLNGRSG